MVLTDHFDPDLPAAHSAHRSDKGAARTKACPVPSEVPEHAAANTRLEKPYGKPRGRPSPCVSAEPTHPPHRKQAARGRIHSKCAESNERIERLLMKP